MSLWPRFRLWVSDTGTFLSARPVSAAAVAVALAAGLVAGTVPAEGAFDYTWRDAEFCDDCHVHDYANEAFFRSPHAGLTTCHDCHRVPIAHYPRNVVLTPLSTGEELAHAPHVESVICSACHLEDHEGELTGPMTEALRDRLVKVDDSPLHQVHLTAESRSPGTGRGEPSAEAADDDHGPTHTIECMDCHGSESNRAHKFEATRANCIACHEEIGESAGRLAELQCQECHFEGFVGQAPDEH